MGRSPSYSSVRVGDGVLPLVLLSLLQFLIVLEYTPRPASGVAELPGLNVIGCGYDVLNGFYAGRQSCRSNLFQFAADDWEEVSLGSDPGRAFGKPRAIQYVQDRGTSLEVRAGNNLREYIEDANVRTKIEGSYNFFSASLESEFGRSYAENSTFSFTKVQQNTKLFTLRMPANPRDYLHPARRADIDAMPDLRQLFDTCGTHFVAGAVVGGSATFTASTSKPSFPSTTSSSTRLAAEMTFKNMSNQLNAEERRQHGQHIQSFTSASDIKLHTAGGSPALGGASYLGDARAWAASVLDYPDFVDFPDDGGLAGLWTLASTPERAQLLLDFYPRYCDMTATRYAAPRGPVLQARIVPLLTTHYTGDSLMNKGAERNIRVCRPDTGGGWSWLGQVALGDVDAAACSGASLLVKEMVAGALGEVGRWEQVWNDTASGAALDFNLWRGVAAVPDDHAVVGDFFRAGLAFNWYSPRADETAGIKAVRKECLAPGKVGSFVWSDRGTSSQDHASVWTVVPEEDDASNLISFSLLQPYFVSNIDFDPPSRSVFVLNSSCVALTPLDGGARFTGSISFFHQPLEGL